jgi:hypothetical protein
MASRNVVLPLALYHLWFAIETESSRKTLSIPVNA